MASKEMVWGAQLVVLAMACVACNFNPTYPEGSPCGLDDACPPGQFCTETNVCMAVGSELDAGADVAEFEPDADAEPEPDADAPTASLTITRTAGGWAPLNLSEEGTRDWLHLGLGGLGDINRKSDVEAQLSAPTHVGGGVVKAATPGTEGVEVSWTDGTPTTEAVTGAMNYVDTANLSGDGFTMEVPADSTPRHCRPS